VYAVATPVIAAGGIADAGDTEATLALIESNRIAALSFELQVIYLAGFAFARLLCASTLIASSKSCRLQSFVRYQLAPAASASPT